MSGWTKFLLGGLFGCLALYLYIFGWTHVADFRRWQAGRRNRKGGRR